MFNFLNQNVMRGRKKGSKNKPKDVIENDTFTTIGEAIPKKRGRKSLAMSDVMVSEPKKRGRKRGRKKLEAFVAKKTGAAAHKQYRNTDMLKFGAWLTNSSAKDIKLQYDYWRRFVNN